MTDDLIQRARNLAAAAWPDGYQATLAAVIVDLCDRLEAAERDAADMRAVVQAAQEAYDALLRAADQNR